MMKLLLVRRVPLSLRGITAVAAILILLHDKSVNCFSPGLVLSKNPLSKGALARLNRSLSKSDQQQQHQQSQSSSSSSSLLTTETQLSCFACGRYASYSLWDGGVVAQEPITLEKFRKDYQLSPYRINRVSLDITILEEETEKTKTTTTTTKEKCEAASGDDNSDGDVTLVKSIMNISPQSISTSTSTSTTPIPVPLELDGEDLKLRYIALNGKELMEKDDYVLTEAGGLIILEPPREFTSSSGTDTDTGASISNSFTLETLVAIQPHKNTQLSGLYKSNGMYVTQCEAQGFRRITYFQDRPDIMATYDVRIEANKEKYPVLLSNGNAMEKGDIILEEGGEEGKGHRHWAKFVDPFPKPSYLFAIVAGDLGKMEGSFQTMNDRDIQLSVWSEPENVDQLDWAMQSLKDAMKFDEETYGREYDLDVYNIVAVNDFNMGAMENKGLNIFNTAAILAKPSTATDRDYERVQGVVGHEYFHNWSGNRVTCRDWFQLTLKEGLTVFRDQHFSEDMTSQAVKRIEDVRVVRSAQFVQDAGPMAHPIRPESYIAMDNFYTVTVYNKGAEVIRMYRTLLGRETFRKAMDLYFERHDGQAVTCDDFRRAMADASTRDLTQFENWYLQAGTPIVKAISSSSSNNNNEGEEEDHTFTLTLSQSMVSTSSNDDQSTTTTATKQDPFHIPIVVAILGKNGEGNSVLVEQTLELTEESQTFVFPNLSEEPYVASINRGFSSPIKLETDYTEDQIAFLAANDDDPFNRWDASQQLYTRELLRYVKEYQQQQQQQDNNDNECSMTLSDSVNDAFRSTLSDSNLDPALRAYSLLLPTFATLSQEMSPIDADAILAATKSLRRNLALRNKKQLLQMYHSLSQEEGEKYEVNKKQVGNRRLRNTCLSILSTLSSDDHDIIDLSYKQFESATSMTDSTAALECLADIPSSLSSLPEKALGIFYERAKKNNEALVINKWLAIQAAADLPNAVENVKALTKHEGYESTNPNSIRSLLQMFASANPAGFHNSDGSGYEFIADQVIDIDRSNPQVAARMASSFDTWSKHTEERKQLMKIQLERIQKGATSPDTNEIVSRTLQA